DPIIKAAGKRHHSSPIATRRQPRRGTHNPPVAGSSPARPTCFRLSAALFSVGEASTTGSPWFPVRENSLSSWSEAGCLPSVCDFGEASHPAPPECDLPPPWALTA